MTMKFSHLFSTFAELVVAATLEKNYSLRCQNGVMVSNSFVFRKSKSCGQLVLLVLRLTFII